MAQRVGNHTGFGNALAFRQEYLNSKLVTVGIREHTYLQRGYEQARQQNDANATEDGQAGVMEGEIKHAVVGALHPAGDGVLTGRA